MKIAGRRLQQSQRLGGELTQAEAYAPIYVRLAYQPA